MKQPTQSNTRRAIVMGASMAGLVAARVLADHFDEVLLLERDSLPAGVAGRKGVPQDRHVHGLLQRGEQIFEELFPGLTAALVAGGAMHLDFSRDFAWYHFGLWKPRFRSEVDVLAMSRPFFEAEVRRRVLALPRVHCRDGLTLCGLLASDDRTRVIGVRARPQAGDGGEIELRADLVVDATGRGSATPKWIAALGYDPPEEESVTVHIGYATRVFRRAEPSTLPFRAMYLIGDPPSRRSAALFPIEGDRWIAVLSGILRDYPPTDLPGYLEFARSLPVDDFYRAVSTFEPLDDGAAFRFPASVRHRYERMSRRPDGLVAVGDALCSFNPMYGQGMTTAALVALELRACLRERHDLAGLPARYYRRAARVIDMPWTMATFEDLRTPSATGIRPPGYAAILGALDRVHRASSRDQRVHLHFLRTMHMVARPTILARPDLLARTLLRGGRIPPDTRPAPAPQPAGS